MRFRIAGAALLLAACSSEPSSPTTTPSDSETDSAIECKDIADCNEAVAELHRADEAMQTEFDKAVARMQTCKGQNTTRCYGWDRAIELVRAEQDSWSIWRLAHCDVFAFTMEGTSAEGMLRAVCRTDLAKTRTAELQQIMSSDQ